MANLDFEQLVRRFAERQQKDDAENVIDWQETRNGWVASVHSLFNEMDAWLQSLIQSGLVKSVRRTTQLTEENLGRYDIECLDLLLASRQLSFEPIGTLLIGALGRIDVNGPNGKAMLLLLNTDDKVPAKERREHVAWFIAHPAWKPRPRAQTDLRPLTQGSFQQLFSDLFGINP